MRLLKVRVKPPLASVTLEYPCGNKKCYICEIQGPEERYRVLRQQDFELRLYHTTYNPSDEFWNIEC